MIIEQEYKGNNTSLHTAVWDGQETEKSMKDLDLFLGREGVVLTGRIGTYLEVFNMETNEVEKFYPHKDMYCFCEGKLLHKQNTQYICKNFEWMLD